MGHLEESSMLSNTSPLVWSAWGSTACQICWCSGILIAFLVRDVVGEVCLSRSKSASCRIEVERVIELTRGCVESSNLAHTLHITALLLWGQSVFEVVKW